MPTLRTEVTEIVTGLATLGYQSINRALEVRPGHISHVDQPVFDRLEEAYASGSYADEFELSWSNGLAFAQSDQGLRGRPPWVLEWKGPHRPASPSIETIPADLRIDHVFLLSCKYGSQILHNSSPSQLIDNCLQTTESRDRRDWYEVVAGQTYENLWQPIFRAAGVMADRGPATIDKNDKHRLKNYLNENPVDTTTDLYLSFVDEVSRASAERWQRAANSSKLGSASKQRKELFWRLLRMQAAPYFLLGASKRKEPIRYRVGTPWDFEQYYELDSFDVEPLEGGQPKLKWSATVAPKTTDSLFDGALVEGFVEIRWSHGKLMGRPEAKVHLTTHPYQVPGYRKL